MATTQIARTAIISNIQPYTIHDGPGIRTEIFFKGCPLRCLWCSNPETINPFPEIGVFPSECLGVDVCGLCLKACPLSSQNVLQVKEGKIAAIDRETCQNCHTCVKACPCAALKSYGQEMTVREIMAIVIKDRSVYQKSGGGITLSGGDCMLQADFAAELLQASQRAGIHTCVESEFSCSVEAIDKILPYTDMVMTDIKHMNPVNHRKYTGVSNKRILSNIQYLAMKGLPIVVRIPVIPGFNDDDENIQATADFLIKHIGGALRQLQLLPYRPLGLEKYDALGRRYPLHDYDIPSPASYIDNIRQLAERLREQGLPAVAGTTTKFK